MELDWNRYGKQRVRVMKVFREGEMHSVMEIEASVLLSGAFRDAYFSDDNSAVVATDTMKNTVHALAKEHLGPCLEGFALFLADHFLRNYEQVSQVEVELVERVWTRMAPDGIPLGAAFVDRGQGRPCVEVTAVREAAPVIRSGIRDLIVMRTTGSGFAGFPRCEYTTLPETGDRLLATSLFARWEYAQPPDSFENSRSAAMKALLTGFSAHPSPSVQRTLFQMGEAALQAVPEAASILLRMPNKHYIPIPLSPFGMQNDNVIFLPTDEPHGEIEALVKR